MNRNSIGLILSFFVLTTNCSQEENPFAPMSLNGTWNLVSYTEILSNDSLLSRTYFPGQAIDIGNGVMETVLGTLEFNDLRIDFAVMKETLHPNMQSDTTIAKAFSGVYSIMGTTLTILRDDESVEAFNIEGGLGPDNRLSIVREFEFAALWQR